MDITSINSPEVVALAYQYGLRVAGAIVLIIAALWISRRMAHLAVAAMERSKVDRTVSKFTASCLRWLIIVAAALAILGMFGVETTSFAAVIAASGLAIGLAFQGSLANVAGGLMLLIFRPFRSGDSIISAGVTGKVDEIGLFATYIDTPDNRRIICPNSKIFGSIIENISHHATRRVDVTVGVAYDAPLDRTKEILSNAIAAIPQIQQEPAPQVVLTELGASSVDWTIKVWTATSDFWAVKEQLLWQAKERLDAAGIAIPFPQMDINLNGISPQTSNQSHQETPALRPS